MKYFRPILLMCFIHQLLFVQALEGALPKIHKDDVVVALMGPTGSGKTTFINLASGSDLEVGGGLKSCTPDVQSSVPFELDGRRVILVDTPGFDDTSKSDTDVLYMIADFLAKTYGQGQRLAGVLYFHRISDFRMGGISQRNFEVFRELCGNSTLKNVAIVTNMWGEVDQRIGEYREHQLRTEDSFFGSAIREGATLLRHSNTTQSANNILRQIIHNHPLPLRIQLEIVDEHLDLQDTGAGGVLHRDLKAQEAAFQEELDELKQKMEADNERVKQDLQDEIQKREAQLKQAQDDISKLHSQMHYDDDPFFNFLDRVFTTFVPFLLL